MAADLTAQKVKYARDTVERVAGLVDAVRRLREGRQVFDARGYATAGTLADEVFAAAGLPHVTEAGFLDLMAKLEAVWASADMQAATAALLRVAQ